MKRLTIIFLFMACLVQAQESYYTFNGDSSRLMECQRPTYPKPTDLSSETGIVAAYNMIPSSGGVLTDISGNGNTGTIYGATQTVEGMNFDGVDDYVSTSTVIVSYPFSINYRGSISAFTGTNQSLVSIVDASEFNKHFCIFISNTGDVYMLRRNTTGYTTGTTGSIGLNQEFNISCSFIDETSVIIWLNGIEILNSTSETSVSLDSNFDQTLIGVLRLSAPIYYLNGGAQDVRFYNKALTLSDHKAYHNKYANEVYYKNTFKWEGVGNTAFGFTPGTGTYSIQEQTTDDAVLDIEKGDKYLKCGTAGTISTISEQAYGTWEFDINKQNTSTLIQIIIMSPNSNPSAFGEWHYWVRVQANEGLYFLKNASNLMGTAASYLSLNTNYRIKITRSLDGEFTLYIKGGNFGNTYTLVDVTGGSGANPVTDNTYTTSQYTVIDNDTDDRIGDFVYLKGIEQ